MQNRPDLLETTRSITIVVVLVEIDRIRQTVMGLLYCNNWVYHTLLNLRISELNKPIMPDPLRIKEWWKIDGLKTGGMRVCDIAWNEHGSWKAVWARLYRNTDAVIPGKCPRRPWKTAAHQDHPLIIMACPSWSYKVCNNPPQGMAEWNWVADKQGDG